MKVVVAAGGTAGHVFPGLALARVLRDRHGAEVTFAGLPEGQEARLVPDAGFPLVPVESRPFARRFSLAMLRAPFTVLRAARRCRPLVRGADIIVGMGGYVSVPVALAARRERRPLIVHEQNAIPGLANRLGCLWAAVAALSFEETARRLPGRVRTIVTGNPVREEILRVESEREALRTEGVRHLDLDPGRRTVLMFGGSQGALHLDRAALGAYRVLGRRSDLQVLLITGPAHHAAITERIPSTPGLSVKAVPFIERMDLAYAVADLVVSRAGATTVAELSVCGVPALLVPYPYATAGHQEANARALQRAGGASVLLDDQLTPESLAERIASLIDHPERLAAMSSASSRFARPDAAERLAELVVGAAA